MPGYGFPQEAVGPRTPDGRQGLREREGRPADRANGLRQGSARSNDEGSRRGSSTREGHDRTRFGRDANGSSGNLLLLGARGGGSGMGSRNASSSNLAGLGDGSERGMSRVGSASTLQDLVGYKYQSLEEALGSIRETAEDQNGCRFLQKELDKGGPEAIAKLLPEVLHDCEELMVDPFGNYFLQKLFDLCSEEQRNQLIRAVAPKMVTIALNTHGTRAMQKLVETLREPEQVQLVAESLAPGALLMIKDLNGNHVIQKSLQRMDEADKQFIYDTVCSNILDVASHSRHGCCVLQRCLDHASPAQKESLVEMLACHALDLAQDPFGNYVIQYALAMGDESISGRLLAALKGSLVELSLQKFSSNVVEKFLKPGDGITRQHRETVVREIIQSPLLARLLNDNFGNYVMQSALSVTAEEQPPLHAELVDALRPYLPLLRGCLHGRRIISKMNLKF